MKIIAAIDQRNLLGYSGNFEMPWLGKVPEDMKWFSKNTIGKTVVMGFNTFITLNGQLNDRKNIVCTKQHQDELFLNGITVESNFDKLIKQTYKKECFLIGGGQLYKLALSRKYLPYIEDIYLTIIHHSFPLLKGDYIYPSLLPPFSDFTYYKLPFLRRGVFTPKPIYFPCIDWSTWGVVLKEVIQGKNYDMTFLRIKRYFS